VAYRQRAGGGDLEGVLERSASRKEGARKLSRGGGGISRRWLEKKNSSSIVPTREGGGSDSYTILN